MPSPRFDANILAVALRLQDKRTDATAGGDANRRWPSAQLAAYQNTAIRDIVNGAFKALRKDVGSMVPEFVALSSPVTIAGGSVALPADYLYILDVLADGDVKVFYPLPLNAVQDVLSGVDGVIVPTQNKPVYYPEGAVLKFLPDTLTDDVVVRYVKQHVDMTANNGTDIPLNARYDLEIRDRMFLLAMNDAKMTEARS